MVYFSEVDFIDLYTVNWNVQYNRNNQTYRMLISICYLVVKGLLQTQSNGHTELMDFLDEQRMCRLYEKFILEYYRKEFKISLPQMHHRFLGSWTMKKTLCCLWCKVTSCSKVVRKFLLLTQSIMSTAHRCSLTSIHFIQAIFIRFYLCENKEYELREKNHTVSGMLCMPRLMKRYIRIMCIRWVETRLLSGLWIWIYHLMK